METKPTLLASLQCKIFGHNYKVSKAITYHVKEYQCSCCKKELTTHINGNLIELTPKFKEINSILSRIHNNKLNRMQRNISFTH